MYDIHCLLNIQTMNFFLQNLSLWLDWSYLSEYHDHDIVIIKYMQNRTKLNLCLRPGHWPESF